MQNILLYRYIRTDGGVTHSPNKPDNTDYAIMYRLVADEGKELVNGDIRTCCIDVDKADGWEEVDALTDKSEGMI